MGWWDPWAETGSPSTASSLSRAWRRKRAAPFGSVARLCWLLASPCVPPLRPLATSPRLCCVRLSSSSFGRLTDTPAGVGPPVGRPLLCARTRNGEWTLAEPVRDIMEPCSDNREMPPYILEMGFQDSR
jgi:hypothetical protein